MIQIYTLFFWCWICVFFKLIVYPVKTWHSSWHSKVIETIKIKTNSIIYITSVHVSLIRWLISYRQNPAVCMTEQYTRLYCIECVGSQWGALITGFMLSFSGFCHNNKNYVWWKTTTYFEILLEKFSSHSFKSRISTLKDFFVVVVVAGVYIVNVIKCEHTQIDIFEASNTANCGESCMWWKCMTPLIWNVQWYLLGIHLSDAGVKC